jgi:hypothetical protein
MSVNIISLEEHTTSRSRKPKTGQVRVITTYRGLYSFLREQVETRQKIPVNAGLVKHAERFLARIPEAGTLDPAARRATFDLMTFTSDLLKGAQRKWSVFLVWHFLAMWKRAWQQRPVNLRVACADLAAMSGMDRYLKVKRRDGRRCLVGPKTLERKFGVRVLIPHP